MVLHLHLLLVVILPSSQIVSRDCSITQTQIPARILGETHIDLQRPANTRRDLQRPAETCRYPQRPAESCRNPQNHAETRRNLQKPAENRRNLQKPAATGRIKQRLKETFAKILGRYCDYIKVHLAFLMLDNWHWLLQYKWIDSRKKVNLGRVGNCLSLYKTTQLYKTPHASWR